ncbi:prepilin-type N-terminal cleavage/methylation domain-containing protein [Candidatus Saccharibacteria bacterium]|nr:prepilin-type N-terminal cleavage/methylation domain-containing protein [Candidatus Saccharibacteria bacterium]
MRRQSGFSIIEVVLVFAVVVVVGLVGYNLYNMQQARNEQTATTQQKAAAMPESINSTSDLDAAAKALDATQLDSNADTATLENDLNQL